MYSRKSRILFFLFSAQPHLARLPLVQSGDVDFLARDGMHLYGYLTLPAGIPAHNLPLVVSVHGGPALRDSWGYSGETQWLANRGYAVLEVNFRGSVGFGKSYFTAGFSQWGTTMIADIVDGARWAVKSGIADSSRLGIMGWSFGGYASIAAAAFYPDVFRCAVDICGPTDLVSLMKDAPPYWNKLYGFLKHYLGDWEKEPEKVKSMSPLNSAARISIPILIAHGEQDPRVDVHEARRFVEALTLANKNVSYFEFPSEGHAFVYQRSQRMLHVVIEGFLKQNLGGRCKELSWSEKGYAELVKKQTQQAMIGR
jgi:dipeptidyl aminopeptidase/acylaminoacyl peptidase